MFTSQKTLAFLYVWKECVTSKNRWERIDISNFYIEDRLRYLGSTEIDEPGWGSSILNYWYYALYFSEFVAHLDVKKFIHLLDHDVAKLAGFPDLGVEKNSTIQTFLEDGDDGDDLSLEHFLSEPGFLATSESFLAHPQKWVQAYADLSREKDTAPVYLYNFIEKGCIDINKWFQFQYRVVSSQLIKFDPSDEEWNRLLLTEVHQYDTQGQKFSLWSIAGKIKMAMINYNFSVTPIESGVKTNGKDYDWFDVIATPKR